MNLEPVGYTFMAENFEPDRLVEFMVTTGRLSPAARDMPVEDVLDQHAGALAIDRGDVYSFDTDDFPKPVFEDDLVCSDNDWTTKAPACDFPGGDDPCRICGATPSHSY